MRAISLLVALLTPSLALAGSGAIYPPDLRYIPGTYLPLQAYLGGVGITRSSAEPALQAINTGTGNAFEAYTQTAGVGGLLATPGQTVGSGVSLTGPTLATRGSAGFVEIMADRTDAATDFLGGGIWMGGDRGTRGFYSDRGYGVVRWTDAFGGTLQFSTLKQGSLFGFASGASGVNESFFQIANGFAVWDFAARSSNVPAQVSYHWGHAQDNLRTTHSLWSTANGTRIMRLSFTASAGSLIIPTGDVSASGSFLPLSDNTGSVGSGSLRFATIRAVTVTTGDLGFEDECCPVCGKCFNVGEDVAWRIRRQEREAGGKTLSRAVPIHTGCAK